MNVLVIPEDSRTDKVFLKPVIEALLAWTGKPHAKVKICEDPILGGVEEALKVDRIAEIVDQYPMVDLFLLVVDRDSEPKRRGRLDKVEESVAGALKSHQVLLGENAWQEVEVWVLAGHELPSDWRWKEVRDHRDPKEKYLQPFLATRGLKNDPPGRSLLAKEAAKSFRRIFDRCPEDIQVLTRRISAIVSM